jgi:hypothetical protein
VPFPSNASPEMMATLPDPSDPGPFERCELDFAQRGRHESIYAMHRDLIRLRRRDPLFRAQGPPTDRLRRVLWPSDETRTAEPEAGARVQ